MYQITFISAQDGEAKIQSITTPSEQTARLVFEAIQLSGWQARLWGPGRGRPLLLA